MAAELIQSFIHAAAAAAAAAAVCHRIITLQKLSLYHVASVVDRGPHDRTVYTCLWLRCEYWKMNRADNATQA